MKRSATPRLLPAAIIAIAAAVSPVAGCSDCDDDGAGLVTVDAGLAHDTSAVRVTVEDYFRHVNAEDLESFFALFDPQVEFHGPGGFVATSLEETKEFYTSLFEMAPEHHDTVERLIISGDRAVAYIQADVPNPSGGEGLSFKAMDWFVIQDGKIVFLHIFFDSQYKPAPR